MKTGKYFTICIGFGSLALTVPVWWGGQTAWGHGPITPVEIVDSWLTYYPEDLEKAAALTTPAMRHFKPPQKWAQHMQPALTDVRFRYNQYEVYNQEIQGKRAKVSVEAFITTIAGTQFQKEEYILLQIKDEWLIDKVTVREKRFLGNLM